MNDWSLIALRVYVACQLPSLAPSSIRNGPMPLFMMPFVLP